jgi:hypothetical protein
VLQSDLVRMVDDPMSRQAYEQLMNLETEIRETGITRSSRRLERWPFLGQCSRAREGCGVIICPALKRQMSFPVSTMSQWWVRRSRSAVVILASPKILGHSPKARLLVIMIEVRSAIAAGSAAAGAAVSTQPGGTKLAGNEGHPARVGGPTLLNPFAEPSARSASIFVDELDTDGELPFFVFAG